MLKEPLWKLVSLINSHLYKKTHIFDTEKSFVKFESRSNFLKNSKTATWYMQSTSGMLKLQEQTGLLNQ